MNLRFLRTFVAIVDNGGLARAAARLNLTQSAASRQIQALEGELGLRLFARIGRGMRLTSEGEDLLERSRRVLSDVVGLGERANALKSGEVGVLRVGATPQTIENSPRGVLVALSQAPYKRRDSSGRGRWRSTAGPARTWRHRCRHHCQLATIDSAAGCSIQCTSWPCCRSATASGRRASLDVTELADEVLLRLTRALRHMAGSRPLAMLRMSARACCWKASLRRR